MPLASDSQAFSLFVLGVLVACAVMFFSVRWLTKRFFASSAIAQETNSTDAWLAVLVVVAGIGFVTLLEFVNEVAAAIWVVIMFIASINASAIAAKLESKGGKDGT